MFVLLKCTLAQTSGDCAIRGAYEAVTTREKIKKCTTLTFGNLTVPGGVQLDLSNLPGGMTLEFTGKIVFECKEQDKNYLVLISGKNVHITGTGDNSFDGNGACYWEKKKAGGKKKPKFFLLHLVDSHVENLTVLNAPIHVFMISNCQNTLFNNIKIDNRAGDGLASNTDGFHVTESTDIVIRDCFVYNQDDCFTATSGKNITFTESTCEKGNGVSLGSIGNKATNDVSDVSLSNITIKNSLNGFRIKTVLNAVGSVSNVKVSDLILMNITDFGIVVRQDYLDAKGNVPKRIPTNGVTITNLTITNIYGTVSPTGQRTLEYCGTTSCSRWNWSNIHIQGGSEEGLAKCLNPPKESSGVKCI
ncbi:hypothetical protein ABG067_006499 [Albugo candida]